MGHRSRLPPSKVVLPKLAPTFVLVFGVSWMDLKWLIFLIRPLYWVGRWFNGGKRAKHHKDTCSKEIGLCLQILITILHSTMNAIGRTHVSSKEISKHEVLITIAKSRMVQFSIHFSANVFIVDLLMHLQVLFWKPKR